ncbi:MAG: hypothetical protein JJU05_10635 [Verrucomicrobia bacterium]|nr:hypothetical protein [Verrucomicrobiota bacterium]MCH8528679.1 hypothetical protein [Kiritimatiellia bacterium]
MLTAKHPSLFSSNYEVEGLRTGVNVQVRFRALSSNGHLIQGDKIWETKKKGVLSGSWVLESGGQVLMEAGRTKLLRSEYELSIGAVRYILKHQGFLSTAFELIQDGRRVGTIARQGIFSTKVLIDCGPDVPELVQLFAFWLVADIWRRSNRNTST